MRDDNCKVHVVAFWVGISWLSIQNERVWMLVSFLSGFAYASSRFVAVSFDFPRRSSESMSWHCSWWICAAIFPWSASIPTNFPSPLQVFVGHFGQWSKAFICILEFMREEAVCNLSASRHTSINCWQSICFFGMFCLIFSWLAHCFANKTFVTCLYHLKYLKWVIQRHDSLFIHFKEGQCHTK